MENALEMGYRCCRTISCGYCFQYTARISTTPNRCLWSKQGPKEPSGVGSFVMATKAYDHLLFSPDNCKRGGWFLCTNPRKSTASWFSVYQSGLKGGFWISYETGTYPSWSIHKAVLKVWNYHKAYWKRKLINSTSSGYYFLQRKTLRKQMKQRKMKSWNPTKDLLLWSSPYLFQTHECNIVMDWFV